LRGETMALEKAILRNEFTKTDYKVLFNPKEYTITKSVQWEPHKVVGLDLPEQEFTSGNPAVLSLELFFDSYEDKIDINKKEGATPNAIMKLALRHPEKHCPPLVIFVWGTFKFK